ncbi:hypothetical protein FW774_05905 [Pedobacter sp. BS3]|uniref:hypothetical protein n=1 Tax=Pedobacter sp. BS3 TaxID=2567937 RepID=UPI0011EFBEC6|nr:hypothetical protein [Pedobacter sp. BS3]TZF84521.1 hypothetical protein FW774_05905 [Pedobacter sp. BS3]
MMQLVKRPEYEYEAGKYSRWCAAWNPIVFEFQEDGATIPEALRININVIGANKTITAIFTPDLSGHVYADISSWLNAFLTDVSAVTYNDAVHTYSNLFDSFVISWTAIYSGSPVKQLGDRVYTFTHSARPIYDNLSGNLFNYLVLDRAPEAGQALFLTEFKSPRYFPGKPFDISFIHAEDLFSQYGESNFAILQEDAFYLLQEDGFNILLEDASAADGSDNDTSLRVTITEYDINGQQLKVTNQAIDNPLMPSIRGIRLNFTPEANTDYFRLNINNSEMRFSEDKLIRVYNSCRPKGFYIRWTGQLGAYNYWWFDQNSESKPKISDSQNYRTIDNINRLLYVNGGKTDKVQADFLNADELYEGFQSLIFSNNVQVYDDGIWKDITLSDVDLKHKADSKFFSFSATLINQDINTQQ